MGPIYCHIILLLYNSQTDYLVSLDVSLLFGKRETATLEGNETIMKTGNLVSIKGQRKTMLLVFRL